MAQSAMRFAQLLQEGINAIERRTAKPKGVIRDELGYAIGRKGGSAIEYWAYGDGRIPRQQSEVEALARILVDVGKLDQKWLDSFLKSAGYPDRAELVAELFPDALLQPSYNLPLALTTFVPSTSRSDPLTEIRYDLLDAPEVGSFFGREPELAQLLRWFKLDNCRVVTILGMGGVGKTSLAVQFVTSLTKAHRSLPQTTRPFDKIIWRSLLNAPPLIDILRQLVQQLSDQEIVTLPPSLDEQLRLLIKLLQQQRTLVVLDNVESIMQTGTQSGAYRDGYGGYKQLLQRIAQTPHNSGLLLTGRERPQDTTFG
ncbi:MAG: NB-ARC domain-containing protein [Chloroflexota bacterium]